MLRIFCGMHSRLDNLPTTSKLRLSLVTVTNRHRDMQHDMTNSEPQLPSSLLVNVVSTCPRQKQQIGWPLHPLDLLTHGPPQGLHLTAGSYPSQGLDCSPLLVTVFHKLISETVQGITVTTQQHAAINTMRPHLHASIQVAITPDRKDTIGTKAQTTHSLQPHTAAKIYVHEKTE